MNSFPLSSQPEAVSQFFIVKHDIETAAATSAFRQQQHKTQKEWEDTAKIHLAHGFHSHSFMPIDKNGPIFCVWEGKPGSTLEDFNQFINGPDGYSVYKNTAWPICNELMNDHGHDILCRPTSRRFSVLNTVIDDATTTTKETFDSVMKTAGDKVHEFVSKTA